MKRLISCFLLLLFLTSCDMSQPEYYDAGYYHSTPPRSEVYGFDEHPHHYRHARKTPHKDPKKTKFDSKHGKSHERNVHGHDEKKAQVTSHPSVSTSKDVVHSNAKQSN